jgi:hypothetical protein
MTLAIRTETPSAELAMPAQDQTIARLVEWAQAADAAYQMSRKLADTTFVPVKYRGKPAEMAAAMLAGAELGLDPMASLRAFHDIQGAPRPAAETLRAIVQSRGHDIRIVEASATKVVMKGRRKEHANDPTAWNVVEWTIEQATTAGFPKKNPNWNTQPKAMLIARATTEVCKLTASDAIMGMPSAEEAQDMGLQPEYVPVQPRVTADEILGVADDQPQDTAQAEPVSAPPADSEPMTRAQQGKLFALFGEKGINSPAAQREYVRSAIGRQIASRSDLTKGEAKAVIDSLEQLPAPEPEVAAEVDMGGAELDDAVEGELQ